MNKKTYRASIELFVDEFSIEVEIDHDVMTTEKLEEINKFWSGALDRLQSANGDLTAAVLKHLCITVFELIGRTGFVSVTHLFDDGSSYIEGWPKMDGSEGIKLLEHDTLNIGYDDVEVIEVTA